MRLPNSVTEFAIRQAVNYLVKDPETWMQRIYEYIGVPFEKETIDYGRGSEERKGLGDPMFQSAWLKPHEDFRRRCPPG